MVPYMGMLPYHKNMNCEVEMSKAKPNHRRSDIMKVFSCIDYEPFSVENCDAYVCLSLKMKHSDNYITFYGLEVEVETVCFKVLTSIEEFLLVKNVCEGAESHGLYFPCCISSR